MTAYNAAFRATVTPSALTPREITANVAALDLPDGWTRADDLELMEGLFMGLKLAQIGIPRGKTIAEMQARFLALRKAAVGEGVLTLEAQKALLSIVRSRAAKGGLS